MEASHMRHLALLVALAVLATATLPAAGARHEGPESDCHGMLLVDVGGQGLAYVLVEAVMSEDYLFSVWLVMESNGVPGCQYDDLSAF